MTQRTNHSKNIYISREEVNGRIPLDDSVSTTCVTNHIVEMTVMEKPIRRKCAIKRLDKDHYVNLRTGEVCEFRHSVKNQRKNMNKAYGIYDSGDGTELNVIYHKQYNKRRK